MILVVGAAGFIGAAVTRAAAQQGHAVHALARRTAPPRVPGSTVHFGDARGPDLGLGPVADELARRVEHVVIAAGSARLDTPLREQRSQHVDTVSGALAFAGRCRQLRSVVLVSSVLAVGAAEGRLASSHLPIRPRRVTSYGAAKHEAERAALASGLPVRIVRPGQVVSSVDDAHRTPAPVGVFELLPTLLSGSPVLADRDATLWAAPVDLVADLTVAMTADNAPRSVWAVDPASQTIGRVLEVLHARHGIKVRCVRPTPRLVAAAELAAAFGPARSRARLAEGILFALGSWQLDLTCLRSLMQDVGIAGPTDLGYLDRTIDHEVARLGALA